jgi:multidrug efflux pump subunit AcrB
VRLEAVTSIAVAAKKWPNSSAIILMMAGALSITNLPVAQYPSIAPPAVSITVTDPGASAETVQSTVSR